MKVIGVGGQGRRASGADFFQLVASGGAINLNLSEVEERPRADAVTGQTSDRR